MLKTQEITLGTDPEVFVMTRGEVLPSYFALGADESITGIDLPFGTLVGDGAAIEWTQTPTTDPTAMVSNIAANMRRIRAEVEMRAVNIDGDRVGQTTIISTQPCVDVPWEYINYLTESFGKQYSLQILGCAPDFDVYTAQSMDRADPKTFQLRTSGMHLHFGIGDYLSDYNLVCYITAALDAALGTASVYQIQGASAKKRATLYGKAGTIRLKPDLGVLEYRVLPGQLVLSGSSQRASRIFALGQAVVGRAIEIFEETGIEGLDTALGGMEQINTTRKAIDTFSPAMAQHAASALYHGSFFGRGSHGKALLGSLIESLRLEERDTAITW